MYYDDHHDYHDQIRQYGSKLRHKNSVHTSILGKSPKAPPHKGPVIFLKIIFLLNNPGKRELISRLQCLRNRVLHKITMISLFPGFFNKNYYFWIASHFGLGFIWHSWDELANSVRTVNFLCVCVFLDTGYHCYPDACYLYLL